MSVIKRKRTKSNLQALYDAQKMRTSVSRLMLKDFGAKPKVRTVEDIAKNYKMSSRDAEKYLELTKKYGITTTLEEFPYWFVDDLRRSVSTCMREMAEHITIANSIYPNSIYECDLRRQHQDIAIGQCEFLLQELQYIMSVIPLNVNKLMPYVEMVEKEIALLKAWRKSDNSTRTRIINNEIEKYSQAPQLLYPYLQYSNNYIGQFKQPLQSYPTMVEQPIMEKRIMCVIVPKKSPYKSCSSH
jgi:hypothetical protein